MTEDTIASQILEQLELIFSKENLAKDNFFREMTMQHPEGWITLKKLSMIKRFKVLLNGDVTLFKEAVDLAPSRFELNSEQTSLRPIAKEEEEKEEEQEKDTMDEKRKTHLLDHMHQQNKRSIYVKGFPLVPEPVKKDLVTFFEPFGRVIHIKLRREDDKSFKGSIFVEFETNEMAHDILDKELVYKEEPLMIMNKQDYVDMKRQEKFDGEDFIYQNNGKHRKHYVEFTGADGLGTKDVKEILVNHSSKTNRFEFLNKSSGIVRLCDDMTPDQFLATLEDGNKLGPLTFRLASDEARAKFVDKVTKAFDKRHRGGRGRGGKRSNNEDRQGDEKRSKLTAPAIQTA
ncbi:uncharacterized protein BX664DRAFT_323894 [Halteromyces radiatus]|uniref:uncharacterized protein n=1 Tax=Halteromyces radiatus TaxID=101107 RepID=UPI0022202329|nr:uncharacterized protein BX664DRAFT_323894 [Halteromyces radiatus]KAI8096390.1 hypothetical protein BX664DRAFT_323894 [Halteromyces radiatus]